VPPAPSLHECADPRASSRLDMNTQVLTVRSTAEFLRVSSDTVRRWADKGVLQSYRLPSGHRRFDPNAVERFREELLKPAVKAE
jgi:excisionase family DNA binding protein